MTVYLLNIVALFFWAGLLLWHRPDQTKKAAFCVLASTQWILISGLRHWSIGADTYSYKVGRFDTVLQTSWGDLLGTLWGTYFGVLEAKDPGYALFMKAGQLLSSDYQVFLVLSALVFAIPLGILIYRYSSDPFLSFLLYSTLFYSFFAITGHRQTLATALMVLIGYRFIVDKRWLPFAGLALVAFTIHKSSIVFLPFYFLAHSAITAKRTLAYIAMIPIVFLFRRQVAWVFGSMFGYERYAEEFTTYGVWTFALMLFLVLAIALLRSRQVLRNNPVAAHWYNALLIAAVFTPVTNLRVVQYFSLFLMLLVPEVVVTLREKSERMLGYWAVASVLIFLFVRNNPQYIFFWQGI